MNIEINLPTFDTTAQDLNPGSESRVTTLAFANLFHCATAPLRQSATAPLRHCATAPPRHRATAQLTTLVFVIVIVLLCPALADTTDASRTTREHIVYYVICNFRLPILQGSNYASLVPIMALMSTEEWRCPDRTLGKCLQVMFDQFSYAIILIISALHFTTIFSNHCYRCIAEQFIAEYDGDIDDVRCLRRALEDSNTSGNILS